MNIAITLDSVCAGGGHVTVGVSVGGGAIRTRVYEADELRLALTSDDRDQLIESLIRLVLSCLTRAQARAKLEAGISVTL